MGSPLSIQCRRSGAFQDVNALDVPGVDIVERAAEVNRGVLTQIRITARTSRHTAAAVNHHPVDNDQCLVITRQVAFAPQDDFIRSGRSRSGTYEVQTSDLARKSRSPVRRECFRNLISADLGRRIPQCFLFTLDTQCRYDHVVDRLSLFGQSYIKLRLSPDMLLHGCITHIGKYEN